MILKYGNLIVSKEKPYMYTSDEVGKRFPVKIAFTRELSEEEMIKLAVYSFMLENGIYPSCSQSDHTFI